MPESFNCPSCHAPLVYEPGASVVRCAYCGNSAIVPEALRPRAPEPPPVQPRVRVARPVTVVVQPSKAGAGCGAVLSVILAMLLVTGGILWAVWQTTGTDISRGISTSVTEIVEQVEAMSTAVVPSPVATATPSVARELLAFGGEGTGVGRLDDAREVGIDSSGTVYVADYSSGRIQRFNAAGEYQGQWTVVNDINPVTSMKVARDGTVFVVQGAEVHRYEGATGTHQGTVTYESDSFPVLQDATPLPDGGLVVNQWPDHLVWLDAAGGVVRSVEVPGREHGSNFGRAAADGQGNVFVLGLRGERGSLEQGVFRYDANGEFLSFFGGSGDEPGQFRAANAIAVDGQGRVYVSDIKGVQIFDPRGRYLNTIEIEGVPFGIAFDAEDHLWVTNREQVFEMEVTEVE
jgi:LSD1 subclass zinc finger protein